MESKKVWLTPKLEQLEVSETLSGDILTKYEDVLLVDVGPYGAGTHTGPVS